MCLGGRYQNSCSLSDAKEVYIRRFGKDNGKHFFLVNNLGTFRNINGWAMNEVFFNAEVNECTEVVCLRQESGIIAAKGKCGLTCHSDTMKIYCGSQCEPSAWVDNDQLSYKAGECTTEKLLWNYNTCYSGSHPKSKQLKLVPPPCSQTGVKPEEASAVISADPETCSVKIRFGRCFGSSYKKMLAIMAVIKFFITYLKYQKELVPRHLLNLGQVDACTQAECYGLRQLSSVILRLAARNRQNHVFVDCFDKTSRMIELVIEYTMDNNSTVLFKNILGEIQFMSMTRFDGCTCTIFVHSSCGDLLATTQANSNYFYDRCKNCLMKSEDVEPNCMQNTCDQVKRTLSRNGRKLYAEAYTDRDHQVMHFDCAADLDVRMKSIILAKTAHLAKEIHGLFREVPNVGTVCKYPYSR